MASLTEQDIIELFSDTQFMTIYKLATVWSILRGKKVYPTQMYGWARKGYYGLKITHVSETGVWLIKRKTLIKTTIQYGREIGAIK